MDVIFIKEVLSKFGRKCQKKCKCNNVESIGLIMANTAIRDIENISKENEQLKQQIEKMKCCLNCEALKEYLEDCLIKCKIDNKIHSEGHKCIKWKLTE